MKREILSVITAATLMFGQHAHALNRDSGYGSEKEEAHAKCMSDPQCVQAVNKMTQRTEEAQARWEQKPVSEKLEPYFWLVVGASLLWYFAGRKK